MENVQIVLNVKELSKYLSVSESSIRRAVQQNALPYFKLLGRILFYKESIDNWINQQQNISA